MAVPRSRLSLKTSHRLVFSSMLLKLIQEGSETGLIVVMPPVEAKEKSRRMWRFGKVLRVEKDSKEGKFGMAIGFQRFEVLSQA